MEKMEINGEKWPKMASGLELALFPQFPLPRAIVDFQALSFENSRRNVRGATGLNLALKAVVQSQRARV
jgi:hypothetical protein